MGLIYNITFFVGREHEADLLSMLRSDFLNEVTVSGLAKLLHITKVRDNRSSGMMDGEEQAVSLGVQFALPDDNALGLWRECDLHKAFSLIASRFGEEVLHFDTLLEVLG